MQLWLHTKIKDQSSDNILKKIQTDIISLNAPEAILTRGFYFLAEVVS